MNKYQKNYAVAKAAVQAIDEKIIEAEHDYIMAKGIKNLDDSIPEHIYCIDENELFEKSNQEFGQIIIDMELEEQLSKAKEILRRAEDAMIEYGISIAPDVLKELMSRLVKTDYNIRCKIIDMVFRLDASTVK